MLRSPHVAYNVSPTPSSLARPGAANLQFLHTGQRGKERSQMSTWLITGCSTGLGRSLAQAVIAAGHNAVVTARDVSRVADLAEAAPDRVLAVALDVTNPAQVVSAAHQAEERFGG